jgi:hypothetical protein
VLKNTKKSIKRFSKMTLIFESTFYRFSVQNRPPNGFKMVNKIIQKCSWIAFGVSWGPRGGPWSLLGRFLTIWVSILEAFLELLKYFWCVFYTICSSRSLLGGKSEKNNFYTFWHRLLDSFGRPAPQRAPPRPSRRPAARLTAHRPVFLSFRCLL